MESNENVFCYLTIMTNFQFVVAALQTKSTKSFQDLINLLKKLSYGE